MTDLVLSERWWGLGDLSPEPDRVRQGVLRELGLEIAPQHELWGRIVSVEAFFEASDDVIVRLVSVVSEVLLRDRPGDGACRRTR